MRSRGITPLVSDLKRFFPKSEPNSPVFLLVLVEIKAKVKVSDPLFKRDFYR